jgi:hypothetical protein
MVGPLPKPCVCGSFSAPGCPFFYNIVCIERVSHCSHSDSSVLEDCDFGGFWLFWMFAEIDGGEQGKLINQGFENYFGIDVLVIELPSFA